jgi:hypothetical protein
MFKSFDAYHYVLAISVILLASYVGNRFKQSFDTKNEDAELIQQYLLNESPLYGHNTPKLWIHTKYEINARKWKSFNSRNTTDLNQPYIHLCIKTIVNHCGDDFNICLIDDESFSKLIPMWDANMVSLAEPFRTRMREYGMAQLLYIYGGIVVPNSFVCTKNLINLYHEETRENRAFVGENLNRTLNLVRNRKKLRFVPDFTFMGAHKSNEAIGDYLEFLKRGNMNPHFQCETEFLGESAQFFIDKLNTQQMNLISGELIGVKTIKKTPILVEDLFEEDYLELHPKSYGLYIPYEDILKRPKYQWFAVSSANEILGAKCFVSKVLVSSIVETTDEYSREHRPSTIQSALNI